MSKQYEFHPAANLFPLLEDKVYEEFKQDIGNNKQQESVKLLAGKIIDGRNRYRACVDLGIEPVFETLPPTTDPLRYAVSANLHRRHLSESQRGMIAGKIANWKVGDNQHGKEGASIDAPSKKVSRKEAAELLNVSKPTVERARKVLRDAVPELVVMVEKDELAVYTASKAAEMPKEEQKKLAAQGPKAVKNRVNQNRKKTERHKKTSPETNGSASKVHQPGRKRGRPRKLPPEVQPMRERAMQLVAELTEMGRWHQARMSPVLVSMIAQKLQREFTTLFDEIAAWLC